MTVRASATDLRELLAAIAARSGVAIELSAGISKTVSVAFEKASLEEGIERIVAAAGEGNLAAEYSRRPGAQAGSFRLERIVVLRRAEGSTVPERGTEGAAGAAGIGTPAAPGSHEADPGAAAIEKAEARRLSRRPARTPEEKASLKRAVLDPNIRGERAADLQIALARSMMEHPEASDRAYVIELLKREAPPGPLLKAVFGGGDNGVYVDYLLEAAKRQELYAIRLLGDFHITEAAPILQGIASGPAKDSPAGRAAGEALRSLGASAPHPGRTAP